LRRLSGERRELQQSMRAHYAGIARQIRASYVMGRQEYLKLLLNQQDPAAVSRTLVYYDYFNRARVKQIDAIDQDLAKLAAVEQRMRDKAAELEASKQRQEEEKRHLLESQTERSEVLAKLENRIESGDQRLKSMLGDEQALIRLIESLRPTLEELAIEPGEQVAFAKQKGKLPWPVKGKISARYGTSRGVGDLKWRGVLITATEGSEVRAISHGRAVFSDWLRGFGMLLIVDHGDGYMTLYGHNQSLYKEVGDWINAGEVIASVGQSGGRQQDGLYFEIRYKGQPTNPIKWCRATPG
jgi:septal ring factor EnvC (AmiA/AmiB activator)